MKYQFIKISMLLFICNTIALAGEEKTICAVVPSYNNINYYKKNLDSIVQQNYKNWHIIYVDDCSSDGTANAVEKYIKENNLEDKIVLIRKQQRTFNLESFYNAIHTLPNNTIVATIDGDDWLAHSDVFKRLNDTYQNQNIWLTYGNYQSYPNKFGKSNCEALPQNVISDNSYRSYSKWVTSQLRTFYAGLFKKIKKEDLLLNNNFFHVATDQAFMYPMLEMAGGKIAFIEEILYIYNRETPINNYKLREKEQIMCSKIIRSKKPYEPITHYMN